MSRSSVNVPNTVPPASTANVEDHDPYTDLRFRRHYEWLTQLDPASLRHYALIEGLINNFQSKELAALGSPTDHTTKLLSYITPFGIESFSVLLKTLRKACPLGKERICELEKLRYPQVVQHSGNVQHETFLLSPKDKIDISRTSPNRPESSGRVKAELGAMRSCFENGSTASDEIVNFRLTPVPTKRRYDGYTESERKRVSTATRLQEEEKPHGEEDRQLGNVYSPGVLPTSQLLSEPTVPAASITTPDGDYLALGPSIEHTSISQSRCDAGLRIPVTPPSTASDSVDSLPSLQNPTWSGPIVETLSPKDPRDFEPQPSPVNPVDSHIDTTSSKKHQQQVADYFDSPGQSPASDNQGNQSASPASDLHMSTVSGRIILDRQFHGGDKQVILIHDMETAMESYLFDNGKFGVEFKSEKQFKSTPISGSVNTLVTVVVDVKKGTDHFETCCRQLKAALVPLLGVQETDVQILSTIPVNSVMMLIMMPVAAMLRFYDWALHAPAILESLGIMRFAALGRAVSVVVKPSALGTEAQVGISDADVLTRQNPTLLKRLESGGLLPPNVNSPGSMSVDEVLLVCGQYAFGDDARMQKLITVVQDVLVVVPSEIVQSASPFGVAGHEPDPVHGQQSAVEGDTDAFTLALTEGTVFLPYGRLVICGGKRTGKSNLICSLLRQPFLDQLDSTLDTNVQKLSCRISRHGDQFLWESLPFATSYSEQLELTRKAVEHADRRRSLRAAVPSSSTHRTSVALNSQSTVCSPEPGICARASKSLISSPKPIKRVSVDKSPLPHAAPASSGRSKQSQVPFNISDMLTSAQKKIQHFIEDLKSTTITKDLLDEFHLDVLEVGSQVIPDILGMLLGFCQCAYAVVYDASKKLSDIANPKFGADGVLFDEQQTNFDVLDSWLNTIQEVLGGNACDVPVFIVGTHVDRIPRGKRQLKMAELSHFMEQNFKDKAYLNYPDHCFVDNTKAGSRVEDYGVVKLRQFIIHELKTQFGVTFPIRWLPFTVALKHIAKEFKRPWLSIEELHNVAVATECVSNDYDQHEFLQMLDLHQDLGHLLHFSSHSRLCNLVIIDVQWLIAVVSLLFTREPIHRQSKKFRHQYSLLYKDGILLESLATHRWSQHSRMTADNTSKQEQRKVIFDICECFALLYDTNRRVAIPGRPNGDMARKFIVPALLPRCVKLQPEFRGCRETPAMYLYSGRDRFFPRMLFWCSVVRIMQHGCSSADPILYQSSARLLCEDQYWLVLRYFQHGLRLSVEIPPNATAKQETIDREVAKLCYELLPYIEDNLEEVKSLSRKHVPICRAAQCPCSFNRKACSKHGKEFCPELDCHHYAPIVEGLRPRCPLGGSVEVDISDVRQYWPCFKEDIPPMAPVRPETDPTGGDTPSSEPSAVSKGELFRSSIVKHVSLLSCCAGFNPSRTAKLLHSKGFLTTPVFNLFKSIQSRQDSAEALLPTLVSLSDSAVCYFVLEALPEMGLEEIALSLQQCPGDAACPLQSGQCHGIQGQPFNSVSDKTDTPEDPWKHPEYHEHHDWLLRLDMVLLRNRAFQAGLISFEEKETLIATSRSGPQVHNDLLLSYAQGGGQKSFQRLLNTLKSMGDRYDETRFQLSKLLPCNTHGDGVCELDSADHHRTMSTSTTELEVPTKATSAAGVGEGPVKEVSSDHNPSPLHSAIETSVHITTTTPTVTSAEQPDMKFAVGQDGRSSESESRPTDARSRLPRVYRSAVKKHSEVFHLYESLDPVQCIKQLYSKQLVSRSTVKDVERSAEKGRHTAFIQCLSHLLQLSDAGLSYFVDEYLRAQHLDLLAETLVNCPSDGVCELDSADHHRTMSTSTTEIQVLMKTTSAAGVGEGTVKEVSFDHNPSPFDSAIETSVCVTTTAPVTSAEQPDVKHAVKQYGGRSSEKKPQDYRSPTDSDSTMASCYRTALELHFKVVEQCPDFDPVDCVRYLRSKRYMPDRTVRDIERVKTELGCAKASARLVTHLSELRDAGVYQFVNHYLTRPGLEEISSTIRHCPGADMCTLDASECHPEPDIVADTENTSPSAGGKPKLADVCSALKKHSEAFHLCEALDPVKCMKRLHSKQHVPRSTVKDVERSALKGRHAASVQCLSHVLQLSDAGLWYFVDKYLHAQHLDSLAMTLVQCPGDGVCELDSAEYHDTESTSTAKLPMVATVSSFTTICSDEVTSQCDSVIDTSLHAINMTTSVISVEEPGQTYPTRQDEESSPEKTHSLGARYRKALHVHAPYFKSCNDLDVPVSMDRLRGAHHATDRDVRKAKSTQYSGSGPNRRGLKILYDKLSKVSGEGLRYFVEDILPELEKTEVLQFTLRHCPGPGSCLLEPDQGHQPSLDTETIISAPMSQQHCGILQQCHTELKDGIDVESHVLDYLYSRSVITKSLLDKIQHDCNTAMAMAGLLLDELPNCGASAYLEFVEALDTSNITANMDLAKMLRDMANN